MKPEFRHGRIVAAYLLGRNGKREEHPAIIISPDREITQPEDFDPRLGGGKVAENLIGVMWNQLEVSRFHRPVLSLPAGSTTGLVKDSAAILNWLAVLDIPGDCTYLIGDVPGQLMTKINDEYRKLLKRRLSHLSGTMAEMLRLLGEKRPSE